MRRNMDRNFTDDNPLGDVIDLARSEAAIAEVPAISLDADFQPRDLIADLDHPRLRNRVACRFEPFLLGHREFDVLSGLEEIRLRLMQRFTEQANREKNFAR